MKKTDLAVMLGTSQELSDSQVTADDLVEQLQMAGQVQKDFLPSELPSCDRFCWAVAFLPVSCVSGDIYDVARLDENHIGFYVVDVVGHGMPAALLTMFIKQALVMRQTTGNDYKIFSPSEIMANLNSKMYEQKLSGSQFATCCYCLLNTETLQLTCARAGHPYPLIIKADAEPKQIEAQGALLGVFEDLEFSEETVQLQRGDKLLLCSDGAETYIGSFDGTSGFEFTKEFEKIKDLPAGKMNDRFIEIVQRKKQKPCEIDDITSICLEIL